jgi:DNA (cytosine-5)-methyltransferase 1
MLKERIDIENIDGQLFEIKIVESENSELASFTHYLYNHKNGVSKFYKKDAIAHVKEILKKNIQKTKFPLKLQKAHYNI